jgi:hypothetical protein
MDPASVRERRRVFETLPEHPECPPGWRTGPPDFVIFGAQKSGTTWWFRLIEQHPGVLQPPDQRPELHFFDRLWGEWPDAETIARYHRYFPRPEGKLIGEKTPEYLSCPWAPPMIKEAAPDARAIVLLRDPVERYVSGLSHHERGGLVNDDEGLGRAFGDRMRVVTDAITRGQYATQLEWLRRPIRASGCSCCSTSVAPRTLPDSWRGPSRSSACRPTRSRPRSSQGPGTWPSSRRWPFPLSICSS